MPSYSATESTDSIRKLIKVKVSKVVKVNNGLFKIYCTNKYGKTINAGLWSTMCGGLGKAWYFNPITGELYSGKWIKELRMKGLA